MFVVTLCSEWVRRTKYCFDGDLQNTTPKKWSTIISYSQNVTITISSKKLKRTLVAYLKKESFLWRISLLINQNSFWIQNWFIRLSVEYKTAGHPCKELNIHYFTKRITYNANIKVWCSKQMAKTLNRSLHLSKNLHIFILRKSARLNRIFSFTCIFYWMKTT